MPGAYGIDEFHKKVEDYLYTHYRARPHWSKNNFLNHTRVHQLYPQLDKWKQVYLLFNRDGTFDNEFTRKCGFEDFHGRDGGESVDDQVWRGSNQRCCDCDRLAASSRVPSAESVAEYSLDGSRTVTKAPRTSTSEEVLAGGVRTDLNVGRNSDLTSKASPSSCSHRSSEEAPMGGTGAIVQQPARNTLPAAMPCERTPPLAADTKEVAGCAAPHGSGAAPQRGTDTNPSHPSPAGKSTLV